MYESLITFVFNLIPASQASDMAVEQCYCDASRSPKNKSIFGLRNIVLTLLFVLSIVSGGYGLETEVSCSHVRSFFESKRILSASDVQDQPNSDAGELCLSTGCCAPSSRAALTQISRTQLEVALRTELTKLAEVLANRAKKFDEFFKKLLQQSREEFHTMFRKTYGIIYEQHSYVFEQLFEQLERYYSKGDTDLDHMMDSFFGILYQKMFTVLNSQYTFDDKYLKCVAEHMRETQPFEDVPHKLSVQLRRAFVATRTFHKALRAGAEVVKNMISVGVTSECITSWTRLRYCGSCSDIAPLACSRYCHNVLRGCLPAHADLSPYWDGYVDAIEKVADRLLGPFNIVMVVEPIDIKISEAIMNFQEHNTDISQKIFAGCGKPVLGGGGGAGPFFAPDRSRRSVRSIPDFDWNQKADDDFEIEASFESLAKDDPMLYSIGSKDDIEMTARRMAENTKDRAKFLQYMKNEIDAEDLYDHERRKRDADPEADADADPSREIDYHQYEFEGKKKKGKKPQGKDVAKDNGEWGSGALERLVRESRSRVRNSRRYWEHLPYLLCGDDVAASPAPHAPCFNGTHHDSYNLQPAGDGSAALVSNPEVRGTVTGTNQQLVQQEMLKTLTARLKDAYNGVEVHWKDTDDLQSSASNLDLDELAGSGSGSGDDIDDLPDDDEDRYPGGEYPASGQGPPDDEDEPMEPETGTGIDEQTPEPIPEVPFNPSVIGGPVDTHNVRLNGPLDVPEIPKPVDIEPRIETHNEETRVLDTPVSESKPTSSAPPMSLHRALLTYALPVVCTWFGTLVTDLI